MAWETCLCRCDRCSSLRSSSRIVAVVPVLSSTVATMAALVSITLLIYPRFRFVRLASRATSCTSAMIGAYALRNSLPPYGVTSMPFRPGCHCPFHRSYRRPLVASAVTGVARCSVCLLSISFCHPSRHLASAFPHVQPSSLFGPSPRVSTAGAYCWQSIVTPRLPWWFSGTHP